MTYYLARHMLMGAITGLVLKQCGVPALLCVHCCRYGFVKGPALMTYYMARHMLMAAITGPRYTFTIMKHQARHGLADVRSYLYAASAGVDAHALSGLNMGQR
jgi:hypothetical protein